MKRVCFVLLAIIFIATTADAQFALESGYNMANLSLKTQGKSIATSVLKGADFGMAADLCIDEHRHFYFQPGLFYEMGGCIIPGVIQGEYDINITDLHLNIEYKSKEKCGPRFMMGIGPNISYYTGGSYSLPPNGKIPAMGGDLKIGSSPGDDLKRRGLGIGLNVGYQFKRHIYIRAHYLQGLSNVRAIGNPDNRIKSSAMGINLGYLFANCRAKKQKSFSRTHAPNHWRGLSKGVYSRRVKYPRYNN